ncbi:DUF7345 domain-containing protein [Halarchaeum salinum]|uniref:DUF7345 domain-containing protein n=1 Tax=Halarchaeum salinum TaxID=489912 RepID=A0AAV3SAL8_9EURY
MDTTRFDSRSVLACITVSLLLVAAIPVLAGPVAAADSGTNETSADSHSTTGAFVVDLQANGSATVTVELTYDLESDTEQAAFTDLKHNETLQQQARTNFAERMQQVAAAENQTDREMATKHARIAFQTANNGSLGVISLSIHWRALAAVNGESLVLTEPFASGFEPDRPFVVTAPVGDVLVEATPPADSTNQGRAVWAANASLEGFQATFAPTEMTTTGEQTESSAAGSSSGSSPGFGPSAVLITIALVAGGYLVRSRR